MSTLYIFSDESGVLDIKKDVYIFSGILFLDKKKMDNANRLFKSIESQIKIKNKISGEMKGSALRFQDKKRIIKAMNNFSFPFFVKINIQKLNKNLFNHKKTKQRYLDYAYKIGIKKILLYLNKTGNLKLEEIKEINIFMDQHTTATNGKYELKESILQEFKIGIFNYNSNIFYEPFCENLNNVNLNYCDSNKKSLIRVADVFANYLFQCSNRNIQTFCKFFICELP